MPGPTPNPTPFPTLSTVIPAEGGADALAVARACAESWSAHLDVLCVSEPLGYGSGIAIPEMAASAASLVEPAHAALAEADARVRRDLAGASFGWTCRVGAELAPDLGGLIRSALRYSDLAILPRPCGAAVPAAIQIAFELLLLSAGLPVLVAKGRITPDFKRVMIAWDGSDPALAATRAALPLLRDADAVEVVTIGDGSEGGVNSVVRMLGRHGVPAQPQVLPRGRGGIAERLRGHAAGFSADLVVMGGYGHSRLREALLGGVTREMLSQPAVPTFVAH